MVSKTFILHWIPRGLCLLSILFISIFSLDVFEEHTSLGKQLIALSIHLIPSYILIGILLLAWKWELAGGILLCAIGAIFTPIIFWKNYTMNQSILTSLSINALITLPFIISGVFFIYSNLHKKKLKKSIYTN